MHNISITTSLGVRKFKKTHAKMWLNIRFGNLFSILVLQRFSLQIVVMLSSLLWQWNLPTRKYVQNGSLEKAEERFCRYFTHQKSKASAHVHKFMKCHKSPDSAGASIGNFQHMSILVTCCVAISETTQLEIGEKFIMQDNSSAFATGQTVLKQLNKWVTLFDKSSARFPLTPKSGEVEHAAPIKHLFTFSVACDVNLLVKNAMCLKPQIIAFSVCSIFLRNENVFRFFFLSPFLPDG